MFGGLFSKPKGAPRPALVYPELPCLVELELLSTDEWEIWPKFRKFPQAEEQRAEGAFLVRGP